MKRNSGLLFASVALLLAAGFTSSAMAIPPNLPGPNDNQSICHQTQHHQLKAGGENDNQKGVIINVDPSSISKNPHIKHGDACVAPINPDPRAVAACAATEPFPTAAACTGEPECAITDDPFDPACCITLEINPTGDVLQCGDPTPNQACVAACVIQG